MSDNPQGARPPASDPYGAQQVYGTGSGYGNVPGYGAAPGYGAGSYGPIPNSYVGLQAMQPEHPQATLILVLGIVSLLTCQLLGPVVWIMGSRARRDIEESPVGYSNSDLVTIGWALGIASTILMIIAIVPLVFFVGFFIVVNSVGS